MWEKVKLEDVCEVIAGQSPSSETYNQEKNGLPFFQGKADFGSIYPTVRYWCTSPIKISEPNDILFSLRAPVGPTNINNIQACIGRGLAAIRMSSRVILKYLLHFLRANEKLIAGMGSGSTFKAITIGTLKNLEIPLPPLPVQQRIADMLDKADALRRKDQELLKKYDELAQAIFIDMFGDPVKNEKGWEVKKLGEVCSKITDGTHHSPKNTSTGFKYITAKHIKNCKLDFHSNPTFVSSKDHKEIYSRCNPAFGDVLYIKDGATTGMAAVNTLKEEFSMLSSLALFKLNRQLVSNEYLVCYLNFEQVKNNLIREFMAGAAIKRFTLQKIKNFNVTLAPVYQQEVFAQKIEVINQLKTKVNAEKSEELFQSLLQRAFKGQLTPV